VVSVGRDTARSGKASKVTPVRRQALVLSWSVVAAAVFAAAALLSADRSARIVLPELDAWRDDYRQLAPIERERAVLRSLGFKVPTWVRLRESLGEGDRYHVLAKVGYQHEIRNYASYALLPAIQVPRLEQADVVVYWQLEPPSGRKCVDVGQDVCVLRRRS
jgi:hypothetical protein